MIPAARRRLLVVYVLVAALLIVLGGRLWYLQVMTGRAYASAAAQDQTRTVIVPPVRGKILDDVGTPLVDNKTALVVSVNRALVAQQADGGISELHRLAGLLNMNYNLLQQRLRLCGPTVSQPCWPGSPYQPIPIDQQASAAMSQLEELLGNKEAAATAQLRSETIKKTIDAQFYDQEKSCYAFSRNPNGSLDRTSTVYPALAWWSSPPAGPPCGSRWPRPRAAGVRRAPLARRIERSRSA